jgi:type I restriction enzyme R subunit
MSTIPRSNFAHLHEYDEQLMRLGVLAEKYFTNDPVACLLNLQDFSTLLAQLLAARVGLLAAIDESFYDLLRRLEEQGYLPREIAQLFIDIRRFGNVVNHAPSSNHGAALSALKISWQLGLWFHRTFGDPGFESGPFIPPSTPQAVSEDLSSELYRLAKEVESYRSAHHDISAHAGEANDEQLLLQEIANEAELAKGEIRSRLFTQQVAATAQPAGAFSKFVAAGNVAAAALRLDEAETRQIIDQQLRQVGWQVDSAVLRYAGGTRPEKGKNMAIAEWPTESGPADYVLFSGLTPVAVVEAKRKNIDVSSALQQAKRYSRGFKITDDMQTPGGPWGEYQVPFAFSSNGRPYLRQLATRSGIWFCDLRRSDNLGHALDGWYTPEGLTALLKRDEDRAQQQLRDEPFDYGFPLRHYQQSAISSVEEGVAEGRREMLLAMATGTGKTKTCIALIYRLLKAQRFKRVLFLVDRSALGEQAANAFKDTRMENLQTFADTFGIKELEEQTPDTDTAVHIATVQGMVKRVLYPKDEEKRPAVDRYDCIVVDECHRGYLLDRELSDTELTFRNFDDYISKYRRVIDYFDAVKIGLTATPALHTSQIFGPPIFTYSYREAVIDGFLIDHEPPMQIRTVLSEGGIRWGKGAEADVWTHLKK